MKINCQCGEKHNISGEYPYVCVKTGEHHCPKCGYAFETELKDNMGHQVYSNEPCTFCGWRPNEENI